MWKWAVLILALTCLLALRGQVFLSYLWSNAGMAVMNQSSSRYSMFCRGGRDTSSLDDAQRWLADAIRLDAENRAAWRGLGFSLELLGERAGAIAAWRQAGLTAQDFIRLGGEYPNRFPDRDLSSCWYKVATEFDPGSGMAWFHLAWSLEESKQWQAALSAYDTAIRLNDTRDPVVGMSTVYYRKGMVHQWLQEPPDLKSATDACQSALDTNDFRIPAEKADSYTRLGQILQWQSGDAERQIALFKSALAIDPSYSTAHVLLGYAYYLRDGDTTSAEEEIEKALVLVPDYLSAYWYLGEIDLAEGKYERACEMYEKVLNINPDHKAARQRLTQLGRLP